MSICSCPFCVPDEDLFYDPVLDQCPECKVFCDGTCGWRFDEDVNTWIHDPHFDESQCPSCGNTCDGSCGYRWCGETWVYHSHLDVDLQEDLHRKSQISWRKVKSTG